MAGLQAASITHVRLISNARSSNADFCFRKASPLPPLLGKVRAPPRLWRRSSSSLSTVVRSESAGVAVIDDVKIHPDAVLGRKNFPPGFTFGAASSAYQVEGAASKDGRGPSIWDTFTHTHPEKIDDKKNGDVAVDSYHRYKEDVKILKDMGMDAYRFSISWSRILPDGTLEGGINEHGIKYYNNMINELIANGIKPFVTLFHWDVPQALETKYGGFLDHRIVDDFKNYCEVCYKTFGDRVKHWITLNEPWTFSSLGYGLGTHAPVRCSSQLGCPTGDSLTEPYIVTHNLILAHAAAARLYKKTNFKPHKKEKWGSHWDMDPLVNGDYPFSMRALVRDRLPYFTEEESEMIKSSFDFIGLNYYTARFARSRLFSLANSPVIHIHDSYVDQLEEQHDGKAIGAKGMTDLLVEVKRRYGNPSIYITENGTCEVDDENLTLDQATADKHRVHYLSVHLAKIQNAINKGVRVKGYFAWSLTDNFEWEKGYTQRFGLNYIDYKDNLTRHPKASAKWFTNFLKKPE